MSKYLKYGFQYEEGANKDEDVPERVGVFDTSCPGSSKKTCPIRAYTVPYDNLEEGSLLLEMLPRRVFLLNVEILNISTVRSLEKNGELPSRLLESLKHEILTYE